MLTGPQTMPVFGDGRPADRGEASDHQVHPEHLRSAANPGGMALGRFGPVTEGAVRLDRRPRCAGRGRRLDRGEGLDERPTTRPSRLRTDARHAGPRPARSTRRGAPTSTRAPPAGPSARWRRCSALSSLMTIAFVRLLRRDRHGPRRSTSPCCPDANALNFALGLTLGLAILFIGIGAIHWAKKLMPDDEIVAGAPPAAARPDADRRGDRDLRGGRRRLRLRPAPDHPPHADRRDGAAAAPGGRPAA